LRFLVWKQTIWQPCFRKCVSTNFPSKRVCSVTDCQNFCKENFQIFKFSNFQTLGRQKMGCRCSSAVKWREMRK
jgi:hypothetical protein